MNEHVPFSGSAFAEANLRRLIALTSDPDTANRDWATMLLAQTEIDTAEVRAALLERVGDTDAIVRAEALVGLVQRDRELALPLVAAELQGNDCNTVLIEAAEALADRTLLPILMAWWGDRANPPDRIDKALAHAIAACGGSTAG
ncbi:MULTISPECIES: HEAT repeat domain-containing protein [Sphingomonas]|uniref:HEAT repeat domain-containing protein n=1 Tax=Sphingomonas TaxID=13687 RepID=UPI0009EA5F42|nr:HEAT repeat domain-containing protein [Sphingomonas sp. CCH10-B3]